MLSLTTLADNEVREFARRTIAREKAPPAAYIENVSNEVGNEGNSTVSSADEKAVGFIQYLLHEAAIILIGCATICTC